MNRKRRKNAESIASLAFVVKMQRPGQVSSQDFDLSV